jgi:hypothetical protein
MRQASTMLAFLIDLSATLPFHIFWDAKKRPIVNVQGCKEIVAKSH